MIRNPEDFFPLYTQLLEDVKAVPYDLYPFFGQAGAKYHETPRKVLFVGKSVNGWVTNSRKVKDLFDRRNPDRIVNRGDQLEWVKKLEGPNSVYNTRMSPFWRVIKGVSSALYGEASWYKHIAWTNLYKISPERGNPPDSLRWRQLETCKKIFELEIRSLDPAVIVFLTSGWESHFLKHSPWEPRDERFFAWDRYQTRYLHAAGKLAVYSPHPQGKNGAKHIDAILKAVGSER